MTAHHCPDCGAERVRAGRCALCAAAAARFGHVPLHTGQRITCPDTGRQFVLCEVHAPTYGEDIAPDSLHNRVHVESALARLVRGALSGEPTSARPGLWPDTVDLAEIARIVGDGKVAAENRERLRRLLTRALVDLGPSGDPGFLPMFKDAPQSSGYLVEVPFPDLMASWEINPNISVDAIGERSEWDCGEDGVVRIDGEQPSAARLFERLGEIVDASPTWSRESALALSGMGEDDGQVFYTVYDDDGTPYEYSALIPVGSIWRDGRDVVEVVSVDHELVTFRGTGLRARQPIESFVAEWERVGENDGDEP